MILFIGASEVIFILFMVLLLFGAKGIPQVARTIGKGVREFQKAASEIKRELSSDESSDTHQKPKTNYNKNESDTKTTENQ
jgi:sec-independent protein translocase protein TatA